MKKSIVLVMALAILARAALAQSGASPSITRSVVLKNHYLHFPIARDAQMQRVDLSVEGDTVREFSIRLATENPDYWVHTDVSEWKGETLLIHAAAAEESATSVDTSLLSSVFQSDVKDGEADKYQEPLRPQFHFSPLRGWLGDSNGLVFYGGEWHLFYQHNPFGTDWGNMTWGHAVSPDLVHWRELDDAIHPDHFGLIFTGSAVVDSLNTAGFKRGKEAPLVAIYSYAGGFSPWSAHQPFTQALAYSLDRGRHWAKYAQNPVLDFGGSSRDPKVFWYAPTRQWIMIVWIDGDMYRLLSSPDLKQWTKLQDLQLGFEMPDMFELALDGNPNNTKWVITGPSDWYVVGTFDGKKFTVEQQKIQGDLGPNYGAVSTYNNVPASDGRRIQQGWLRDMTLPDMPFNQQMAFPRELTLHSTPNGFRLYGAPVREVSLLHDKAHRWKNVLLNDNHTNANDLTRDIRAELSHVKATFAVDTAKLKNSNSETLTFGFDMRGYIVLYNPRRHVLQITRPGSDVSEIPVPIFTGPMTWEILQDRTSVEIFINNGIVRMASGFIPDSANRTIQVVAHDGEVLVKDLEVFEMKSAWQ